MADLIRLFDCRPEQMEFYRDCPIDPDTSSYYCMGGWEEQQVRQGAVATT